MRRMDQPADGEGGEPEFPVGSYLPTKKALQVEYKISLATLDNAFDLLVEQHRIAPQQGRGTQVIEPSGFVPPAGTDDDHMMALINKLLTRIGALTGMVASQEKRLAALEAGNAPPTNTTDTEAPAGD